MEGKTPRTVVHLHGGHVPPDYDGFPESTFVSGGSRLYRYPNTQLPTTLWYHDHALGITRYNVMMGLAGLYVIRDRDEEAFSFRVDRTRSRSSSRIVPSIPTAPCVTRPCGKPSPSWATRSW